MQEAWDRVSAAPNHSVPVLDQYLQIHCQHHKHHPPLCRLHSASPHRIMHTHACKQTHTQFKRVASRLGSLIANYQLSEEPVACIFVVLAEVGHAEKRKNWQVNGTAGTGGLYEQQREKLSQVLQLKVRTKKEQEPTNIARRCDPPTDGRGNSLKKCSSC